MLHVVTDLVFKFSHYLLKKLKCFSGLIFCGVLRIFTLLHALKRRFDLIVPSRLNAV